MKECDDTFYIYHAHVEYLNIKQCDRPSSVDTVQALEGIGSR